MRLRRSVLVAVVGAAVVAPGQAAAASPPAQDARLTAALRAVERLGARSYALAGERWQVRGTLAPFAERERVELRFYRGGRLVKRVRAAVRQIPGRSVGRFSAKFRSRRPGSISVRVRHLPTRALRSARAPSLRVKVLVPRAGQGARGPLVTLLQRALAGLHFAVRPSGRYDARTARAVLTYRKVNRLARNGYASRTVVTRAIAGRGAFHPRHPGHGRHVEADLSRQVIALIEPGGRVHRVYPTSSGKPSTPTIRGSFRFYRKSPGTNDHGMFDSSYFRGGYAIHGYPQVPNYAASHGCLRVYNADAPAIFHWIRLGDGMDVYR